MPSDPSPDPVKARQRLAGSVIVVIGGTTGLGLSGARAMVGEGARVVVVGRNEKNAALAEQALGKAGAALVGDATVAETAELAIALAGHRFGGFHGLYHVAGGSGRSHGDGPLDSITDEGWDFTLQLNLTSVFYSNRAAVRAFLLQGKGGVVLNMGSVLGFAPAPEFFSTHAYAAAKAAIIGLTRSCASRYAPDGIRFNVLCPALVATPMSRRAQLDQGIGEYMRTKQPLGGGGIGDSEDLDAAVVYFVSEDSRCATGQVLSVDGGWAVSEGQYR